MALCTSIASRTGSHAANRPDSEACRPLSLRKLDAGVLPELTLMPPTGWGLAVMVTSAGSA